MTLYFDTCALIPYYRSEPFSASIQSLLQSEPGPVAISHLVEVEFASVLARLVRMKEIEHTHANMIQGAFSEDIARGCYRVLPIEEAHFKLARDWLLSRQTSLRTLDSLHLAITANSQAELVSLDEVLLNAARKLGIPVRQPN